MTLSYTLHLRLAVPDFLTEPWHGEFAAAMDSIDQIIYDSIILQNTSLWLNSHTYVIGNVVISPDNGSIYSCAVAHTSTASPQTFTQELIDHPTFWIAFAPTLATQPEAEAGVDNTKFMSPLRTKQSILANTFATSLSTQAQAEAGADNTTAMTPLRVQQQRSYKEAPQHGRLTFVSGTQLKFSPFNGSLIKILGVLYDIPLAGIAGLTNTGVFLDGVAGQNLPVSTTLLVCAFDNAGVVTADFRTATTHTPDGTAGNVGTEVLDIANTRTVIGMVRTSASAQFQNDAANRLVISWFNRRNLSLLGVSTGGAATGSTTYVELAVGARVNFLTWAEENVPVGVAGSLINNTSSVISFTDLGIDSATPFFPTALLSQSPSVNFWVVPCAVATFSIAEGFHFFTPIGKVSAGTGTYSVFCSGVVRG